MSFDEFMNVVKGITASPQNLQTNLLNAVKNADQSVHNTFFSGEVTNAFTYEKLIVDPALKELSVKYLSFVISTNTTYEFNRTIKSADYSLIKNWFKCNTATVGQNLFIDYMMQPNRLGPYFKDAANWAKEVTLRIGNNDFLTDLLVECDTKGSNLPARVLLLMLKVLDNGGPHYQDVLKVWKQNEWWKDVEGFDTYPWLQVVEPSFCQNATCYDIVNSAVTDACKIVDPPYNYTESVVVPTITGTASAVKHFRRMTYGSKVLEWIDNSSGPKKYGLRSGDSPSNTTTEQTDNPVCVSAGIPILMADCGLQAHHKLR